SGQPPRDGRGELEPVGKVDDVNNADPGPLGVRGPSLDPTVLARPVMRSDEHEDRPCPVCRACLPGPVFVVLGGLYRGVPNAHLPYRAALRHERISGGGFNDAVESGSVDLVMDRDSKGGQLVEGNRSSNELANDVW